MIDAFIIAHVLILFRVTAFVMFMPPIAGQGIPGTVKTGLSVALTVLWGGIYAGPAALVLYNDLTGPALWVHLGILAFRESALGAGLAWILGLCLIPIRTAGVWIAQEMGLTIGGLSSPLDQQPTNVISQCLEAIGVLMFFTLNMHHTALASLGISFTRRPVGSGWIMPSWEGVVSAVSLAVNQGFWMIAPVGILLFVTLLVLLVTMRSAPQFNFMSYGMTLRLIAGMLGLVLFFPEIAGAAQLLLSQMSEGAAY